MAFNSLTIYGYKGFRLKQTLEFAQPNGELGSGLTVIVGPNNSGKSSILEALGSMNKDSVSFSPEKRNLRTNKNVEIKLSYTTVNQKIETVKLVTSSGSETTKDGEIPKGTLLALPSRRFFNPLFSKNSFEREQYSKSMGGSQQNRSQPTDAFAYRLFQLNNPEIKTNFNKMLKEVLPNIPNWAVELGPTGQYYIQFLNDDIEHTSEGIGEGILNLFYIIDALYDSTPMSMIVIDEPEVSLHPSLQKRLMNLMLKLSSNRQIVIATHSPYFLPLEFIDKGLTIVRVNTNSVDGTHLCTLSDNLKKSLSTLLIDLNVPHTLGINAKEVFFLEESVILVEGQEDVVIYPYAALQLGKSFNGSFFGWGVGGASKMEIIAGLLNELGFKKVVGILDGDKLETQKKLQLLFPNFFFYAIPTKDIRDKKAVPQKGQIHGMTSSSGLVKDEYKPALATLIDDVNFHLQ